MAVKTELKLFDYVELLEPIDEVPAGAWGGLVDFLKDDTVILDILEPHLDFPVVVAHIDQLRRRDKQTR